MPEEDRSKFFDCLDKMRSVIGDSVSESVLHEAAKSQNYDAERALDLILSDKVGREEKKDIPTSKSISATGNIDQGEQRSR